MTFLITSDVVREEVSSIGNGKVNFKETDIGNKGKINPI